MYLKYIDNNKYINKIEEYIQKVNEIGKFTETALSPEIYCSSHWSDLLGYKTPQP